MATARRPTPRISARALYTALILAGGGLVTVAIALVFLPAALLLAGLGVGAIGLVGLGSRRVDR
jgi:hypothetical protein